MLTVLIYATVGFWHAGNTYDANDFLLNWIPARILSDRQNVNIYTTAGEQAVNEYRRKMEFAETPDLTSAILHLKNTRVISSPFLYALFSRFSSADYPHDLLIYRIICFASFIFMVLVWFWWLRYPLAYALLILLFVVTSWPLLRDAVESNANRLQFVLLTAVLCLLYTRRAWGRGIAGLLLALLIAYKPNLVFVPPLLYFSRISRRQFRPLAFEVAGFIAGLLVAGFLTLTVFDNLSCWTDWLSRLKALEWSDTPVTDYNFSIALIIWMRWGIQVTWPLMILLFILVLSLLWFAPRRALPAQAAQLIPHPRRPRPWPWMNRGSGCRPIKWDVKFWDHGLCPWGSIAYWPAGESEILVDARNVALGCLIYILSARVVWAHYYTLCLPMFLITARPGRSPTGGAGWVPRTRMGLSLVFGLMVALIPLARVFRFPTMASGVLVSWTGAFGLFCLGCWDTILSSPVSGEKQNSQTQGRRQP